GRLFVQVLRRAAMDKPLRVTVERGDHRCSVEKSATRWELLRTHASWDLQGQFLFAWLERNGLADVQSALLEISSAHCAGAEPKALVGGRAGLEGADPRYAEAVVARTAITLAVPAEAPGWAAG